MELPMPQKQINGAVDNFICKIRTGSSELEDTTERSGALPAACVPVAGFGLLTGPCLGFRLQGDEASLLPQSGSAAASRG